jgi:hypothetical protein
VTSSAPALPLRSSSLVHTRLAPGAVCRLSPSRLHGAGRSIAGGAGYSRGHRPASCVFPAAAANAVTGSPWATFLLHGADMFQTPPIKPRTIRAVRRRATAPPLPPRPAPEPEPELSNYELIERRSRELEIERAHGGPGTPQPPEAETPLLFSKSIDAQQTSVRPEPRRPRSETPTE